MVSDRCNFRKSYTGAVINSKHIEPRQFFKDARKIVLDRVRDVLRKRDKSNIKSNIKINTVFNGEFVTGDKSAVEVLLRETINSFVQLTCKTSTSYAL